MSIQALIDAAQPGETVIVPPGIYRERPAIDRSITLLALPGAEIRGSDVWTGWAAGSGIWTSALTVPSFPQSGVCDPDSDGRCQWPEQVFYDGAPLYQVATGTTPTSGQFALDAGRHVVIADNPSGHTVEVTTREAWLTPGAANVTVRGFTMRHAAAGYQRGALTNGGYSGWMLLRNTLSGAHGAPVSLDAASGLYLIDNDISRGGQQGVHVSQITGSLIAGNRIHGNNTEGFDGGWEAGGIKISESSGVMVRENQVYDNDGQGIWADVDARNVTITRNRAWGNTGAGIIYETSHSGTITGNACWQNTDGIMVSNSDQMEVSDNLVAFNSWRGIIIYSRDRGAGYQSIAILVRDNAILAEDPADGLIWWQDYAGPMLDPASNNRGLNNRFWFPAAESAENRFHWEQPYSSIAAFAATQGGVGSAYLPSQWAADSYRYALGIDRTCRTVAMGSSSR